MKKLNVLTTKEWMFLSGLLIIGICAVTIVCSGGEECLTAECLNPPVVEPTPEPEPVICDDGVEADPLTGCFVCWDDSTAGDIENCPTEPTPVPEPPAVTPPSSTPPSSIRNANECASADFILDDSIEHGYRCEGVECPEVKIGQTYTVCVARSFGEGLWARTTLPDSPGKWTFYKFHVQEHPNENCFGYRIMNYGRSITSLSLADEEKKTLFYYISPRGSSSPDCYGKNLTLRIAYDREQAACNWVNDSNHERAGYCCEEQPTDLSGPAPEGCQRIP